MADFAGWGVLFSGRGGGGGGEFSTGADFAGGGGQNSAGRVGADFLILKNIQTSLYL